MSCYFDIETFKQYFNIENIKIPIIAGPCSAESRNQMISIAGELSKTSNVFAFRCGLWKPRTRPGGFQGVGEKAFPWIKEIKEIYNLKVCVEVATPSHVEMCLKENIDFFWIGARTTGNPFSIDELCEALKGVNIPIMIKNPLSPDLQLWIGAIERLYNAGCQKVIGVHRGYSLLNNDIYRNHPYWQNLIDFKEQFDSIPLLCDPSHIAGNRDLIFEISQKAIYYGVQGLMIEVHSEPEHALTDKFQQITPLKIRELIRKLSIQNG